MLRTVAFMEQFDPYEDGLGLGSAEGFSSNKQNPFRTMAQLNVDLDQLEIEQTEGELREEILLNL